MIKIQETFNNGSLKDFNPQDLMNKVINNGYSLHTIRLYKGYLYEIYIQYSDPIHFSGADDTEQKYFADIIKIDENDMHNQERILITDDVDADEIVDILEDWKYKVLSGN